MEFRASFGVCNLSLENFAQPTGTESTITYEMAKNAKKKKNDQGDVQPVSAQQQSLHIALITRLWLDLYKDIATTRYCDICNRTVTVGLGGDLNFGQHEMSKDHQKKLKEKSSSKLKDVALTRFFRRKSSSPKPSTPHLAGPSRLSTSSIKTSVTLCSEPIDIDSLVNERLSPAMPDINVVTDNRSTLSGSGQTLIRRLSTMTSRLSSAIPIALETDVLARFKDSPLLAVLPNEDPWESVIDPLLNQTIGFGVQSTEIAQFIRRGPMGMDGFCRWIEICLMDLKIDASLLEMRLERVFDAMKIL